MVLIQELASDFAEDKDVAAHLREHCIREGIENGTEIVLDFTGVNLVTQSFIHAMISDVIRTYGEPALRLLVFKGCAAGVKGIIETVVQYSLETMDDNRSPS